VRVKIKLPSYRSIDVLVPVDTPVWRPEVLLVMAFAKRGYIHRLPGFCAVYRPSYIAPNPPDPYEFKDEDTLAGRGVEEGSILAFEESFVV